MLYEDGLETLYYDVITNNMIPNNTLGVYSRLPTS